MIRPAACLGLLLAAFLASPPSMADTVIVSPPEVACDSCANLDAPPVLPVVTVDGPLDAVGLQYGLLTGGNDNPCPPSNSYPLGVIFENADYKGRWVTFCAARPCIWQEDGIRNHANYGVSWLKSVPYDGNGKTWDDRVSSLYSAAGSSCIIKLNEDPEYQGRGIACWNGGCTDVGEIDNLGSSLRFEYS